MTELDNPRSQQVAREAATNLIGDLSKCPSGSVLLSYVGVCLVGLPDGGSVVVRVYPCGPVDGSTERGILGDALSDSQDERRS
ncbi:hypothetical protein PV646_28410 [Streptomyces sp. ID05-26A]|nr:hypothetical protein [Streptomyces sp. ID05-26A]